jgi:N-acetylglucosamine kinase-like BadF-type ATPase
MKILVADIGKTKTFVMIFDSNFKVYCSVVGGSGDISLDESIALKNLDEVVSTCLEKANLSFDDVKLAVFTFAGIDTKKDYDYAFRLLEKLGYPRNKVAVESDAVAAFYAVTWGEPGVAVIGGTGAIAFGMDRFGRRTRSSGWGWLIGDEGSASWIALQALNAASRAYDGRGPKTTLVERIKQFFKVEDLLDIVTIIYRAKEVDITTLAELARIVDEEAEKGDEVSKEILIRAGKELALAAYSVAKKLDMDSEEIVVGGVGGVFESHIVRESFEHEIKKLLPKARIVKILTGYKAITGSIVLALRLLGIRIDNEVRNLIAKLVDEGEKRVIKIK